jgi:hypothetical protein
MPRQSHWNLPAARSSAAERARRLALDLAVGEQDRVALPRRRLVEQLGRRGDPRRRSPWRRRCASRSTACDGLAPGDVGHLRETGVRWVHHLRHGVTGQHREPGAVDDLLDRDLRGPAGRGDLGGRHVHRARRVDDDDLRGLGAARPARRPGSAAGDRHDAVHVGGTIGQVLVLEHLGSELRHARSSLAHVRRMGDPDRFDGVGSG